MNKYIIKQDNTGIRVGNFVTSTSTGKIILNGVEITDIDTFNKAVDTFKDLQNEIEEKDKEIERLNNIIDELEKWYKKQYEDTNKCLDYAREHHNLQEVEKYTRDHNMFAMCMEELDKLKELKEGK